MSFGYSIGDFIAGANLSYRLLQALSSSQGPSQEYQEALIEIGAIHQAFLQKMGWVLFKKDELRALKDALHLNLNSISVLLATAQFHERMPSAVSQYQVTSPSLPSISSPVSPSDSQLESQLSQGLDVVRIPRPLTDTPDMDKKDNGIKARFAKLEEFMNQHHIKEPANSLEADDTQSAVVKHSAKESRDSLEVSKAGSEPFKEIVLFSRFEKLLKEQQQRGIQDSGLLLDLERILMRMERGTKRGTQMPIKFKDADMEELIKKAFLNVDIIGTHVQEGHYDLIGPRGEIILPQAWEAVVEPDMAITMHMWPMPEKNISSINDDDDGKSSRSASPTLVGGKGLRFHRMPMGTVETINPIIRELVYDRADGMPNSLEPMVVLAPRPSPKPSPLSPPLSAFRFRVPALRPLLPLPATIEAAYERLKKRETIGRFRNLPRASRKSAPCVCDHDRGFVETGDGWSIPKPACLGPHAVSAITMSLLVRKFTLRRRIQA
ncbi:hypothetical protein V500_08610 [Pseudogymnoascus sp. VKM F-4518 (FW-2643)]|nr:hypothetical protein V500_08610 [Pseudogymnoascus sp. VKM F-4518 (FW-2643)]